MYQRMMNDINIWY